VLSCSSLKSCGGHLQDGMHMKPCTSPSPLSSWHKAIMQQIPSWYILPSQSSSISISLTLFTCVWQEWSRPKCVCMAISASHTSPFFFLYKTCLPPNPITKWAATHLSQSKKGGSHHPPSI
jgi:hypothetical protein